MSTLATAKCRVEIFHNPKFFDDRFDSGWSTGMTTDGDKGQITIPEGENSAESVKITGAFHTPSYKKLVIACVGCGCNWRVRLYDYMASEWVDVTGWLNSSGLKVIEFDPDDPRWFDVIEIQLSGSEGQSVRWDTVAICGEFYQPVSSGDLIDELTITQSVFSQGIGIATLTVPNFNGENNGITETDLIIIRLARTVAALDLMEGKAFCGKIIKKTNIDEQGPNYKIQLECHDWGYEANFPPSLLQKIYSATNGKTIIEEALAPCSYLKKHPTKWFNADGHTNCGISSTHDVLYDEVKPATVLNEIMEKAENPAAVKGFDGYVDVGGYVVGHARNSADHISAMSPITPQSCKKSVDIYRIQNKNIRVYGAKNKNFPLDGDGRTEQEDSETPADKGWSSNGTLAWSSNSMVGSESVQATKNNLAAVDLIQTLPSAISCYWPKEYKKLHFYLKAKSDTSSICDIWVKIYAPDADNYFLRHIGAFAGEGIQQDQWQKWEFEVGPNSLEWLSVGSPDWKNVQGVYVSINAYAASNLTERIDGFYFGEARFSGSASDSNSQDVYGERCPEPVVDDSLGSDAECLAQAQSIRDFRKDPVTTLENVLVDGDLRYLPGDRIQVIVSNDNLNAYFRILQVLQRIYGVTWDAFLMLSNEPQYVDYVFRLLSQQIGLLKKGV